MEKAAIVLVILVVIGAAVRFAARAVYNSYRCDDDDDEEDGYSGVVRD